jgi:polygalacturonase
MKIKASIAIAALAGLTSLVANAQSTTKYSWSNLPKAELPSFKRDTFNIKKYGAVADGLTLNTRSINDAINACSAKGGGVVEIPAGLWITGPIVLKSNVNLHVSRAALVQFTDDKSQFKLVEGNYEGHASMRNESPISGTNVNNIAITGEGIFDGNGGVWRAIGKDRLTSNEWKDLVASGGVVSDDGKSWYPSAGYVKGNKTPDALTIQPGKTAADYAELKDFFRPNMLVLTNCKKVLLKDATFQNSPNWCLHTLLCEELTLQQVHVRNPWNAQNGDGIDVESCRNVLIEGSTFDAGDDGICVKSGRDEEGRKRGKPTENMVVRNNVVYRAHGGFVIGSEMSGGAKNIFVTDCTFIGTDIGLRFKTTRGRGGIVEDIYIKNIAMKNIVNEAILFDMYYMVKAKSGTPQIPPVTEATPQFRHFFVSNIVCNGAERAIMIRGLPEMAIQDIHMDNMVLKANKGAQFIEAKNISLKNVTIESKDTKPVIDIQNSSNITLDGIKYPANAEQLFNISGEHTGEISVTNTNVGNAKSKVEFTGGAQSKALNIK